MYLESKVRFIGIGLYEEEGAALKRALSLVARVKKYGWTEEERRRHIESSDPLRKATEGSIALISKKTVLSRDAIRGTIDSIATHINATLDEMINKIASYEPATSRQTSFNDKGEFKG